MDYETKMAEFKYGKSQLSDKGTRTWTICPESLHAAVPWEEELSMGPFCVKRSNATHQLTDPTRPNPICIGYTTTTVVYNNSYILQFTSDVF